MRRGVLSQSCWVVVTFLQFYWLIEILERHLPESFLSALATKDISHPSLLFYFSWAFCRFYTFFCTWFLTPSACNSSMHLFSFFVTGPSVKPDPCKTVSRIWICLPCLFLHRFFVYASVLDLKITSIDGNSIILKLCYTPEKILLLKIYCSETGLAEMTSALQICFLSAFLLQ